MPQTNWQKWFSRRHLFHRMLRNLILGFLLIFIGLLIGMLGYHRFEHMNWVDAFANAAMILSGMGPFGALTTTAGKIFSGFYALFSGLFFILVVGIILAPLAHHTFKKFKIEDENNE